jgi:hypothetical protein
MSDGWSAEKRVLAGLGAMVLLELLEQAVGLRHRAARAVAMRVYEFDRASRHGSHRAEVIMFLAGMGGARRHHR